jgi:hypothetical protein
MKISIVDLSRQQQQNGSTVLVLMTLLGIMLILAVANSKALIHLRREIKRLETGQIERLNTSQANAMEVADSPVKHEVK